MMLFIQIELFYNSNVNNERNFYELDIAIVYRVWLTEKKCKQYLSSTPCTVIISEYNELELIVEESRAPESTNKTSTVSKSSSLTKSFREIARMISIAIPEQKSGRSWVKAVSSRDRWTPSIQRVHCPGRGLPPSQHTSPAKWRSRLGYRQSLSCLAWCRTFSSTWFSHVKRRMPGVTRGVRRVLAEHCVTNRSKTNSRLRKEHFDYPSKV